MFHFSSRLITTPTAAELKALSRALSVWSARALPFVALAACVEGYVVAVRLGVSPMDAVSAGMSVFCIVMLWAARTMELAYLAHVVRQVRPSVQAGVVPPPGIKAKLQWLWVATLALQTLAWLPIVVLAASELIRIDPTMISLRIATSRVIAVTWLCAWPVLIVADVALTWTHSRRAKGSAR